MKTRKNLLDDKTILVTGGTGSFGNQMVERLLQDQNPHQIIIYSRDEKKQYDMRKRLSSDKLKFIIGDVRDKDATRKAMKHIDIVFHAAAYKQVPTCEFFPLEAVKTNILGSNNVLDAAEEAEVEKVVILSTDKAVYPINAMGMTKGLMEKSMTAKARLNGDTTYCGVRYGNVMFSRGSVLPLFINQIKQNKELTVTNPDMTRFLLPLPVAIDLVLYAIQYGENGDMLVKKSPAATIGDLAEAMSIIFEYMKEIKIIGIREGEKMHETLVTREELMKAETNDSFYRIRNLRKLDYEGFFSTGKQTEIPEEGYTSYNTHRLSLDETIDMLLHCNEIKQELTDEAITNLYPATKIETMIQR
ncbi:MAG: SDR family NAD(P)-dependent oxidoreductase [Candidatus Bathyarchaeota archaeon]|nr:SDR family NAD(P)-dependent oxidoreductase [Candidatus Bathyarchaeota archaeon]